MASSTALLVASARTGRTAPLARPRGRAALLPALALPVLLALLLAGWPAQAAEPPNRPETPNRIVDVAVEGAVTVEKAQILSAIASRVDSPLDPETITRDLHTITAMGFFQDARAYAEEVPGKGYRLVLVLLEKPRIVSLEVTGNALVPIKSLQDAMTLKVGSVYSQSALEANLDKIRGVYHEKGYFKVNLATRLERLNAQQYALTVVIEESPRIYITDIRVKGAHVISELEIKRLMRSGEVDCFDWMTDSGVFDEAKINSDLQVITSDYLAKGYLRVFIEKPKITLIRNPEFSRMVVVLSITEGAQYFTGQVDVSGDILGNKQDLMNRLLLKTGQIYSPFDQNQDSFGLSEVYQEQGYAFVLVNPDRRINDTTHIVDVNYQIHRGDKAYVGRIEFTGNRETRDFVLRREFQVRENELYNGRKLRDSQTNLKILGYFKPTLAMDTSPTDVGNVLDLVTRVEEAQTGSLQAQIGYSDQSGLLASLSVSKGNLGGRGQTLRFSTNFAERNVRQSLSLSFLEPHVFETDYSSESALFYAIRDDLTELQRGTITEATVSQGFGYRIIPQLQLNFTVDATNRAFTNVDFVPEQLHTLTTALNWRSVNSPIFPTEGSIMQLALSQVGGQVLQGSTEYRRYRVLGQRFISLNRSSTVVLMGRATLGWLEQVGDNVIPPEDRFRIGGLATLRGYNFLEVGGPYGILQRLVNSNARVALDVAGEPILDASGNPIFTNIDQRTLGLTEVQLSHLVSGGIQERIFNLEMLFPLAGETMRGVVFYDAGQVNAEPIQYTILHETQPGFLDLLQSYGGGLRMITPLGVFRFEYGVKINPGKRESPDKFDFTISTLF